MISLYFGSRATHKKFTMSDEEYYEEEEGEEGEEQAHLGGSADSEPVEVNDGALQTVRCQLQEKKRPNGTHVSPPQARIGKQEAKAKRLKRELQVALAEEDYAAAIRIRDHPFMVLYSEIEARRSDGDEEEAEILSEELRRAINESGEPED